MKDRCNSILEMLTEQKRIEVAELAATLGVSQVTIRKDLDALEKRGVILREHGFAVLRSGEDLNSRLAFHYEIKQKIAEAACQLVQDGETVMIESGSCCALLADAIAAQHQDVTIVTNSAFIAGYIRTRPGARVILLGGCCQNESQVMVGPMVRQCAQNFFVEKLFIGTDGYSSRAGFTNSDHLRAQAVRDMAPQAEQVIVLTESVKFTGHGVVPLQLSQPVHRVITDSGIPSEAEQELLALGTIITKADSPA